MILGLLACAEAPPWADRVVDAPGADQAPDGFSNPELASNGARGGGPNAGGTDVYSLDREGPRTSLTLSFSKHRIIDGDGADLVVFENPFQVAGGGRFMDLTVVEVSDDGVNFVAFPGSFDGTEYSSDPALWYGLAGIEPVVHDVDDPTTPAVIELDSGGDRFDLADVGLAYATHVRLSPAVDLPADPVSNGPDIDAVYALNFEGSR